jgi:hypothetical protein
MPATRYAALSELGKLAAISQGRRALFLSALAPGFHISHPWRSALCTFGLLGKAHWG